ncbi:MAG TPA: hypothetical protein VM328_03345 [Fimbriimonadaceae bacterium]|nr:hypothetical protein [Fimbriimonadaceae bacterium]
MFGFFFYLGACLVAAFVLTTLWVLTRPLHAKDDVRSWRMLFILYVLCCLGPYGYVEVMTRVVGTKLKAAVEDSFAGVGIRGDLQYYKVVSYNGRKARVIAVGEERQEWGGTDRPVVAFTMVRKGEDWESDSYNVVYSDRLSRDGTTLPPYW